MAALLLVPLLARGGLARLPIGRALLLAGLGGLGFALLAYNGFRLAPASHGSLLIHGMLPLFTLLANNWSGTQRSAACQKAGAMLMVAGAVVSLCP